MYLLKPTPAPFPPCDKPGLCRICKQPYVKTSRIQRVCPKPECREQAQRMANRKSGKKRKRWSARFTAVLAQEKSQRD
jgi:hypothetical protein